MFNIRRIAVLGALSLVTTVVALGWQGPNQVRAHGVFIDQKFESGVVGPMGIYMSVGQEFTPATTAVTAVDVRLGTFGQQGTLEITLHLRSGDIGGPIVMSETMSVPLDQPGGPEWIHYELAGPSSVTVTPGQTYVIELLPATADWYWLWGDDGYPGGRAIYNGSPDASIDNLFRTYGQEAASIKGDVDCNGTVNAVDALKILRHNAGLSVAQTQPCITIGDPS